MRAIWALAYSSGRTPEQALWEYERLAQAELGEAEAERERDTLPAPEPDPQHWPEERATLPALVRAAV